MFLSPHVYVIRSIVRFCVLIGRARSVLTVSPNRSLINTQRCLVASHLVSSQFFVLNGNMSARIVVDNLIRLFVICESFRPTAYAMVDVKSFQLSHVTFWYETHVTQEGGYPRLSRDRPTEAHTSLHNERSRHLCNYHHSHPQPAHHGQGEELVCRLHQEACWWY